MGRDEVGVLWGTMLASAATIHLRPEIQLSRQLEEASHGTRGGWGSHGAHGKRPALGGQGTLHAALALDHALHLQTVWI